MTPRSLQIIKLTCLVALAFGALALAASHPATAAPWALVLDVVQWPPDGAQGQFSAEARILNAIHGGGLCGWAVLLYWMADVPLARGDRGARTAYVASVTLWFVLDSLGSLAAGWPGNVLLNLVFFGLLAGPVLASRRPAHA